MNFLRLKIGIGRPNSKESSVVAAYVLSDFSHGDLFNNIIEFSFTKYYEFLKFSLRMLSKYL
jgi:peptidyl-tRNA hydrolase